MRFLPKISLGKITSSLGLEFKAIKIFAEEAIKTAQREASLEELSIIIEIDKIYVSYEEKSKKGFKG